MIYCYISHRLGILQVPIIIHDEKMLFILFHSTLILLVGHLRQSFTSRQTLDAFNDGRPYHLQAWITVGVPILIPRRRLHHLQTMIAVSLPILQAASEGHKVLLLMPRALKLLIMILN